MHIVALGVASGVGSLVIGGMTVHKSYREWEEINEDPFASSWEKAWIIFKGVLVLISLGAVAGAAQMLLSRRARRA